MSKTYRVGVLGLTHDHVWGNLEQLVALPNATLVAAADPHTELQKTVHDRFDCTTYSDYEDMLDSQELDAVYIFSDNATGTELCQLAASRSLHILIEKPLAATLAGADEALAAVRQTGVRLMVNWPFAWWPQMQHVLRLVQSGEIGRIQQVKYRAAHAGPKELGCSEYFCDWLFDADRNGAGALIDYCCYGCILACTLLGSPCRVTGVSGRLNKDELLVEDNAILVMLYQRAMAVAEGSWTEIGDLTNYRTTIQGTTGTFFMEPRQGGKLLKATTDKPNGEEVTVPELPPEQQSASAHFLACLESGEPFLPMCQDRLARDAQEILQAGLQSAREGMQISLPLPW